MVQWLVRSRSPARRAPARTRPRLEPLETREVLSTSLVGTQILPPPIVGSNKAPVITNFDAVEGYNNTWTFSGKVTDEKPAGLTVMFGGLPSLTGKTATVQADGTFSLVVQLQQGEGGIATAQTVDWYGMTSNIATDLVIPT